MTAVALPNQARAKWAGLLDAEEEAAALVSASVRRVGELQKAIDMNPNGANVANFEFELPRRRSLPSTAEELVPGVATRAKRSCSHGAAGILFSKSIRLVVYADGSERSRTGDAARSCSGIALPWTAPRVGALLCQRLRRLGQIGHGDISTPAPDEPLDDPFVRRGCWPISLVLILFLCAARCCPYLTTRVLIS
jgi:hypothetical protein